MYILQISCEKDMRKKQRRQSMLVVDRSLYDWRDLPTPEEICANVISIVGDVAPGTFSYTGMVLSGATCPPY
jgi:glutamate/tyrosine decarboxylase-like PLP-dependent enzyme